MALAIGVQVDFIEGWAVMPFHGSRSHFWSKGRTRSQADGSKVTVYHRECGGMAFGNDHIRPLVEGDYERCKLCCKELARANR